LNKDFTSKEYLELYPNEETIKNSSFQKKKKTIGKKIKI
jgi:hypothetical protein